MYIVCYIHCPSHDININKYTNSFQTYKELLPFFLTEYLPQPQIEDVPWPSLIEKLEAGKGILKPVHIFPQDMVDKIFDWGTEAKKSESNYKLEFIYS